MKVALYQYRDGDLQLHPSAREAVNATVGLVLCFGARHLVSEEVFYQALRTRFPTAIVLSCSTAGEVFGTQVADDTATVVAMEMAHTPIVAHAVNITDHTDSFAAGKALRALFAPQDLTCLFVLSDGGLVNGSELVRGLSDDAEPLLITGGLAGDGPHFTTTVVGLNQVARPAVIAAVGFYGSAIQISHGSQGGWEMFGLEKRVTRSVANILYEIDGRPALELYKRYLGPDANELPGSALLFPLSVTMPGTSEQVVRTILTIDDAAGSMTFAGDVPEGAQIRFMRANFDRITTAASGAAMQTLRNNLNAPSLAVLISCVGRKLILGPRTYEELEAVDEAFLGQTPLAGFYSYGEISPLVPGGPCLLHNQTMTITTFYEAE
jgi:hypothetical protein